MIGSISYSLRRSVLRNSGLVIFCLCTTCLVLAAIDFGSLLVQADHGPVLALLVGAGPEPWWYAVSGTILLVSGLPGLFFGIRLLRHRPADENRILLDGKGLSFVLWGQMQKRWPWQELSEFRISKGWVFGRRSIKFAVLGPASAGSSQRLRRWVRFIWYHFRPGLRDVYDAPLDEIAERLNAYRHRALNARPELDTMQQ